MSDIPIDHTKQRHASLERATQALVAAIAALRHEVVRRDGGPDDRESVREAIREVVDQARADGLRAEHLVVVVRAVWSDLGSDAFSPVGSPQNLLVTTLIKAFYQEPVTQGAVMPPDGSAT